MMELKEIELLIKAISKFPGLGPKSAKRIILKLINNKDEIMKPTINALVNVYKNISKCNYCGVLKSSKEECNCSYLQKKFTKIWFEDGKIVGAELEHYLLEKARLVGQGRNERNYHIFYFLLRGSSPEERKLLFDSENAKPLD